MDEKEGKLMMELQIRRKKSVKKAKTWKNDLKLIN